MKVVVRGSLGALIRFFFPVTASLKTMPTTSSDVGKFLEERAKLGEPVYYSDVLSRFPDLPPITGEWMLHPLCRFFGNLDAEDQGNSLPFRTALVIAEQTMIPGQGFFDTFIKLRGPLTDNKTMTWVKEFNRLINHYQGVCG
jgi:hypothetical protein